MTYLIKSFLRGLLALVPLVLSVAALLWFFNKIESFAKQIIETALGPEIYFVGMGLIGGTVFIIIIGIIMTSIVAQKLHGFLEKIIAKLPVLKTIYFAIDDFMEFFASPDGKIDTKKVVLVDVPGAGAEIIGILTNEQPESLIKGLGSDRIAVYLPMSYQIGGFTVFIPKEHIKETQLSVEEAMKLAMTGWMKKADKN